MLFSLITVAQEGTASPYSFFGIGDVRYKGTNEMRAMAGVGVEQDSIHINLDNPASFSNLKLSTLALGGTYSSTKLKTETQSASTQRTSLDYLAVGLPIGKFGFGFGLIPYSSVGYKIESIASDASQNSYRFNGTGGMNKVFFGLGYQLAPGLSLGADFHYNFGKITTNSLEFVYGIPVGTKEINTVNLSGVNFNTGLMYQTKITKKMNFYSSLNISFGNNLHSTDTRNVSTVIYDSAYNTSTIEAATEVVKTTSLGAPSKITMGIGIGESKKWLIGTQFSIQGAANLINTYNSVSNVTYGQYQKISLGGYFIPNYSSFSSYTKRMIYRAGIRYEKTGLIVNQQSIKDAGITFGVGLPIAGIFSNANIGFEIGKKGTISNNLVQENYANLCLSLSLNDKWFQKRKFN